MTVQTDLQTISMDIAALQAVVRGLCRAYAGRSPASLAEVLDGLSVEADRLDDEARITGDGAQAGAHALLEAYIDSFREDVIFSTCGQKRASF